MTNKDQQQLGKTRWAIADNLHGAMNTDDFRDYMLSFLFLKFVFNYEEAGRIGKDYLTPESNNGNVRFGTMLIKGSGRV